MPKFSRLMAVGLAILYILLSFLWLHTTDTLLPIWVKDPNLLDQLIKAKGYIYVIMTGLIFFIWFLREADLQKRIHQRLLNAHHSYADFVISASEGFWVTDATGKLALVNDAFCKLLCTPREAILGHALQEFLHQPPPEITGIPDILHHQNLELTFLRPDGSQVAVIASISPSADVMEIPGGSTGMVIDISERFHQESILRASESHYRTLFESSPISLWIEDYSAVKLHLEDLRSQGIEDFEAYFAANPQVMVALISLVKVLDVNQATLNLFGAQSKNELLSNLNSVLEVEGVEVFRQEMIAISKNQILLETYGINYKIGGQRIEVWLRFAVDPDNEQTYARVMISLLDVTERRRAERELRETETRYRMLVENVSAVIYTDRADEHNSSVFVNPYVEQMTGYSPGEWFANPDLFLKVIHPDDREWLLKEHQRTGETGERFEKEYRIVRKDGKIVWVHDIAMIYQDEITGERVWNGLYMDITERKEAEEAQQQSEGRFRMLLHSQGEGTVLFNTTGRFVFVNPAAEHLFGAKPGTLAGHSLRDFAEPHHADELFRTILEIEKGSNTSMEVSITRLDGERRMLLLTLTPWSEGKSTDITGCLAVCRDITERKKTEQQLRYESTHDSLTGIYNRRFFDEKLSRLDQSEQLPISLIVLDVNELKRINDSMGHLEGDETLRRVAQILLKTFRQWDTVARIGGDEFAVLINNTDVAGLERMIARLRQNLQEDNVLHSKVQVGLAIGTAIALNPDGLNLIFQLADQAMYTDKGVRPVDGHSSEGEDQLPPFME